MIVSLAVLVPCLALTLIFLVLYVRTHHQTHTDFELTELDESMDTYKVGPSINSLVPRVDEADSKSFRHFTGFYRQTTTKKAAFSSNFACFFAQLTLLLIMLLFTSSPLNQSCMLPLYQKPRLEDDAIDDDNKRTSKESQSEMLCSEVDHFPTHSSLLESNLCRPATSDYAEVQSNFPNPVEDRGDYFAYTSTTPAPFHSVSIATATNSQQNVKLADMEDSLKLVKHQNRVCPPRSPSTSGARRFGSLAAYRMDLKAGITKATSKTALLEEFNCSTCPLTQRRRCMR
ncbi:unnamed protein product [Protopolystoma xenopodis]|uniref:Uncharacterized protein n=1 Tax=Protopolystoma xenopodis TaxID=117903 RepID=A0A3S5BWK3_9PLAT|nr:unnamed protein product [Protopolystoma xenopodis]